MSIHIHKDKCVGCTLCIKVCPFGALSMSEKKAQVKIEQCTFCGACVDACKFDAITIKREKVADANLQAKGVWVFCEQKRGIIQSVSYELLGKGKELAKKLNTDLCAVLLGHEMDGKAQELIHRGADVVYLVNHPSLKNFLDDPYTNVLTRLFT